jgi:hypothetical protein
MSATLKLTRTSILLELRRGTFTVLIDGKQSGSIESKETTETPVEPGHHSLRVQEGRYTSREVMFDVAEGDIITFRCSGARVWPIWLASFAIPNLALTLSRE